MNKIRKNQAGFSAVEVVLVLVIVGLIGVVGFMVYKNHNKTNSSTTTANTTKAATSVQTKTSTDNTTSKQQATTYFTIKEWGVKAPYTGQDTYTYTINDDQKLATVISKQLAIKDSGCSTYGAGQIKRLAASDDAYAGGGGPTVEQYAKQNPGAYTYVGGYFYQFVHDQAECGNISVSDQNQANDAVKALVASFRPVSQ